MKDMLHTVAGSASLGRSGWQRLLLVGIALLAFATPSGAIEDAIAEAMADERRSDAERERDANRKPAETLAFFGLEADQRVLELFPGGGWYTKILGPVLAEDGELHVFGGGAERLEALVATPGLSDVQIAEGKSALRPTDQRGIFEVDAFELERDDFDLVLTFRNLHNFTPDSRKKIYAGVLAALEDGGRFGVIDHTRRHMAPDTREVWRRLDPVLVVQEATEAGFRFVGYSDLHYRPDDELRYEVGRSSVKGNTDRFTLLFEKAD